MGIFTQFLLCFRFYARHIPAEFESQPSFIFVAEGERDGRNICVCVCGNRRTFLLLFFGLKF